MACLLHSSSSAEPIPFGEPGVRPTYAPDRSVRLEHVGLDLHLDPAGATFRGQATLRFRPYPSYDGTVSFDLDEVEVTAVTDLAGSPLSYEHGDAVLRVRAGAARVVVVRWSGRSPRHGLYFVGPDEADPHRHPSAWTQCQDEDAHFVVPCHDHPSVKHPWSIVLSAPPGYTLLSNGRQVSVEQRDGLVVATFEQAEPMPAYLLTLVAAQLDIVAEEWRGKAVRYLVPTGRAAEVALPFGRTCKMLDFLSERTGVEYPWPRYDQVVVHEFVFGGMENVACTTMTDLLLVDAKAALEWDAEALVVHELAHQWFGDLLTCQDWSQGWLNESWATYAEALWAEHVDPPADATWTRWELAQGYHAEARGRYCRPIVSYDFREPIDLFDRHLYNKGGTVLGMLRHQLGDEAFFGGVRTYLRRHAHSTVHTRHFQRAMEEVSGRNLDGFFAQWIHSPGHPVVEVKLGRDGDELVTVQVKQTQTGEGIPVVFRFPLDLELVSGGRVQRLTLDVSERERTFVIPVTRPVDTVRVDPGYRVLAELSLKGPEAWLTALTKDPCPVLALRAGKGLLAEGSRKGRDAVAAAVSDHPFHAVRGGLAKELVSHLGPDEAVAFLAARLTAEAEPRALRMLATALGTFRSASSGPAAADALLGLLTRPLATWQLEGAALAALGSTRDLRATAVLRAALLRDSWADHVRCRAIEGLAETEDPTTFDDLVACTRSRFPDRTRAAAATALARLAEAHPHDLRRRAVERLIELVAEPGFRTQNQAMTALGRLRDDRAAAALSRVHRTAPDGRTRRTAYEALAALRQGRTGDESIGKLQRRLDELSEENARLRGRVDRLERP